MANEYDIGDLVRVSGAFTDRNGAALDPTVVSFKFKDPSDTTTTYVYSTHEELVKDGVGHYHANIDVDEAGTWYYRWVSEGTGQAAEEGTFTVRIPNIS